MQERKQVLLVMWRSLGHLNASFGVARRLERLGFHIAYVGPPEICESVQQQGHTYYPCQAFEGLPLPVGVGKRVGDLLINIT
jgi:hypothetical protein